MSKILFVGKDFHPDTLGVSNIQPKLLMAERKKYINVNVITGHPYYPEWKIRVNILHLFIAKKNIEH